MPENIIELELIDVDSQRYPSHICLIKGEWDILSFLAKNLLFSIVGSFLKWTADLYSK